MYYHICEMFDHYCEKCTGNFVRNTSVMHFSCICSSSLRALTGWICRHSQLLRTYWPNDWVIIGVGYCAASEPLKDFFASRCLRLLVYRESFWLATYIRGKILVEKGPYWNLMPTYLALFPEISLANDSKTKICKSIQTSATFATNPVKCLGLLIGFKALGSSRLWAFKNPKNRDIRFLVIPCSGF